MTTVHVNLFGTDTIAEVVDKTLEATAGGGATHILTVAVDGKHYRVPAASADPVPR